MRKIIYTWSVAWKYIQANPQEGQLLVDSRFELLKSSMNARWINCTIFRSIRVNALEKKRGELLDIVTQNSSLELSVCFEEL
jgi:hypothetical protein